MNVSGYICSLLCKVRNFSSVALFAAMMTTSRLRQVFRDSHVNISPSIIWGQSSSVD